MAKKTKTTRGKEIYKGKKDSTRNVRGICPTQFSGGGGGGAGGKNLINGGKRMSHDNEKEKLRMG